MNEPIFEVMNLETDLRKYPFSCHIVRNEGEPLYIPSHYHYEIELLFFFSGEADVSAGNKTYKMKKGEMLLINAMEVHTILVSKTSDTKYITIMFNPSILKSSLGTSFENKYITLFSMENSNLKRRYTKDELEGTVIPIRFENILKEFKEKIYGFEIAVNSGIYDIILWILRNCYSIDKKDAGNNLSLSKNQIERYEKVFEFVEKNYAEDISSKDIVEICNIDYAYFSRQFKIITGKTFREYLNFVRISKAEKLLLTTDMNVTQIALAVGFSNASYFTKQFKRYKHISPVEERKLISRGV